jgi:hypothetical protein
MEQGQVDLGVEYNVYPGSLFHIPGIRVGTKKKQRKLDVSQLRLLVKQKKEVIRGAIVCKPECTTVFPPLVY